MLNPVILLFLIVDIIDFSFVKIPTISQNNQF